MNFTSGPDRAFERLMLETVCTSRKTTRVAGDDYPAELVKSKYMKLNGEHIRFVLDCLRENTTRVRNIKQYLRAMLFNAPAPFPTTTPRLWLTIWHSLIGESPNPASRTKACNEKRRTTKDIAPYIAPKFENNILLTQTERLTMTGRPKTPRRPGIKTCW